jgi:PTS system nitrogen regulatory IIA component
MTLADIIEARAVLPNLHAQSKKQLLQELADAAAPILGIDSRVILETLRRREKLGSTGLGQGIAIPHGKLAALDRVHGLFARLAVAVPFDAIDGQPVDLVFLLLAPEHAGADHLKALARISRLMRDGATVAKLRGAKDAAALYAILTEPPVASAA